jgi:hypothetical protein
MTALELLEALKPIAATFPNHQVIIEPYIESAQWIGSCQDDECQGEEKISDMTPVGVRCYHQSKHIRIETEEA